MVLKVSQFQVKHKFLSFHKQHFGSQKCIEKVLLWDHFTGFFSFFYMPERLFSKSCGSEIYLKTSLD